MTDEKVPAITIEYEGVEPSRLEAINQATVRLCIAMNSNDKCHCPWSLLESIWPARLLEQHREYDISEISLVLVPLSRIGQMEGKSGSLVLIGYLKVTGDCDLPNSHPIVVKTMPAKEEKLEEEFRNGESIRPYAYDHKDVFAIPFRFDDGHDEYHVLWSMFSASESLWHALPETCLAKPRLVVRDLRSPIIASDNSTVDAVLKETFSVLRNFHVPFGRHQKEMRCFGTEYDWYLRRYNEIWGDEWHEVWGPRDVQLIDVDGEQRVNPLWVVEKLMKIDAKMTMGAVHGDLHPGNIVLSASQHPRIIDFGWSRSNGHIAQDFVLLECNFRFLMLRPQLALSEVRRFSEWFEWDDAVPSGLSDYSRSRAERIQQLRTLAKKRFQPKQIGTGSIWFPSFSLPLVS